MSEEERLVGDFYNWGTELVRWKGNTLRAHGYVLSVARVQYAARVNAWGEFGLVDLSAAVFTDLTKMSSNPRRASLRDWIRYLVEGRYFEAEVMFWQMCATSPLVQLQVRGDWRDVLTTNWPDLDDWGVERGGRVH